MTRDDVPSDGQSGPSGETVDPARFRVDAVALRTAFAGTPLAPWSDALLAACGHDVSQGDTTPPTGSVAATSRATPITLPRHGDLPKWRAALARLPELPVKSITLDHAVVAVDVHSSGARHQGNEISAGNASHAGSASGAGSAGDAWGAGGAGLANMSGYSGTSGHASDAGEADDDSDAGVQSALHEALTALKPWRKGPFRIADVEIDCEWRSDWKWDRLVSHLAPLDGRLVLDVGCGSGYHLWRLRGAGAAFALGIDPGLLFACQFDAIQRYIADASVQFLPLTLDALPAPMALFDTVLSMGVLYHRRDHEAHLAELRAALGPGGELVLETLISPSEADDERLLGDRYARMRNVHALPSATRVARWIEEAGFVDVRLVSVDVTSTDEQRSTDWMPYQSLVDALDPAYPTLTIEGHPRPRRAILLARKP